MKAHCTLVGSAPDEISISPFPTRRSAPVVSSIVRESIEENTLNAILVGKLAFIKPVIILVVGRWVDIIR